MVKKKIYIKEGSVGVIPGKNISYEITPEAGVGGGSSGSDVSFTIDAEDLKGQQADKVKISKWGADNIFPSKLKALYYNNIFSGLCDFKTDMIAGSDFVLQSPVNRNGRRVYELLDDEMLYSEIETWLDSWNYFDFIINQITDFVWIENCFGQMIKSLDGKTIAKLAHLNAEECRLTVMNEKTKRIENIAVRNWEENKGEIGVYPLYNPEVLISETKGNIIGYHNKKPSFGFKYYNYPVYIGALQTWLPLANEIPLWHLSNMKNSMNIKYHIKIPVESIKRVQEIYRYGEKELQKWVEEKVSEIDSMLAGTDNVGKAFYSYKSSENGKDISSWEINTIENKIKEVSESFLNLFNDSNQAITSAMQVQPSLACIQLGDKMSSGSEVLNAYNLHVKTRTPIARRYVLNSINTAIAYNWPFEKVKKKIVLGVQDVLLVQQSESKSGVKETNTESIKQPANNDNKD